MTLRMLSLWIYGYVWIFIIVHMDCKRSRVCYSTQRAEPKCVSHTLQCGNGSPIAITSAIYSYIDRNFTNDKGCSCGSLQCDVCTGGSKFKRQAQCYKRHRDVDYWNLVSTCSYQRNCSVPVPSQQTHKCGVFRNWRNASYSRIGYWCFPVSKVVDFCNGSKTGKILSIMYKTSSRKHRCLCSVIGLGNLGDTKNYTLRSFDVRNTAHEGGGNFNLSFVSRKSTRNIINHTVRQYAKLFEAPRNQETVIHLTLPQDMHSPESIWILVHGMNRTLKVTCTSESEETTRDHESTSTTISTTYAPTTAVMSSSQSSSLTKAAQITTISPQTERKQAGAKAGPIAGGGIGGVVVIAVIAVLAIYCRRRKTSNECPDESKRSHINPVYDVVEHESIYSIAGDTQGADAQVNNNVGSEEVVESCEHAYFKLEPQNNNPDYMNVDVSPNKRYDHVSMVNNSAPSETSKDKTESVEDNCYNHLGTDVQKRPDMNSDYDTAASASKAVKDLENKDDYYSYDHLGASTGTTVTENDYDTTATRELNTK